MAEVKKQCFTLEETKMAHNPNPARTLDPALVRMLLDSQANKFLTVTFYKANGELVSRNGQLRAASRLVGNERGQRQAEAMKARGQVWLAKPDGGSASFYLDRVTEIKAGGAVIARA